MIQRPADYIVVYISDDGRAQPDPAVLIVDRTREQKIYFVTHGTELNIRFSDEDQVSVRCDGKRCTAKLNPNAPPQDLVDHKYTIELKDRGGKRRIVDPVVIIDEIR